MVASGSEAGGAVTAGGCEVVAAGISGGTKAGSVNVPGGALATDALAPSILGRLLTGLPFVLSGRLTSL